MELFDLVKYILPLAVIGFIAIGHLKKNFSSTIKCPTCDDLTSKDSTSKCPTNRDIVDDDSKIENPIVDKWYNDRIGEQAYNDILKQARKLSCKRLYESDWRVKETVDFFIGDILNLARKICDDKYTITQKDLEELCALNRRGFFNNQLKFFEKPKIDPCFVFGDLYIKFISEEINEEKFKSGMSIALAKVEKLVDKWYHDYMEYILMRVFWMIYRS